MVVVDKEVLKLIKNKISLTKISKLTGIGKSTLYFHYKKINGKKTIPINFNFSNEEEKGEFLGIFAGDGSFYKRPSGHYTIRIHIGYYEKHYADFLENKFTAWFSKKPCVYFGYHKGKKSVVTIQYYSKEIYNFIKSFLEWEIRKTYTIRLKDLNLKDKEFNIGFLRGLIDTDGNFYAPKRRISFASTSRRLSDQASKIICNLIGKEPNLNVIKKEGKHDLYVLTLHGENAKRLINIVKPNNINKKYAALI